MSDTPINTADEPAEDPFESFAKDESSMEIPAMLRKKLTDLREEIGRHIDPETAEVWWTYAQTLDPYDDIPDLSDEYYQVGREYFARSPGWDEWISFCDLPEATREKLWDKHGSKLASWRPTEN